MRALMLSLAISCLTLIAGCTAPPQSTQTQQPAAAQPAQPAPPATAADPPTRPAPAAAPATPPVAAVEQAPLAGAPATVPSRACRTDADCTVKDVGNCCGYYPMCVNKGARTDPAAVRAQCEKEGTASICGFPDISGCQCVKGQCANLTNGEAVM